VEILSPEDWNKVVDALEELDKRSPLEYNGGLVAFNGDGATTQFRIPHGLPAKPTVPFVFPASPDARRLFYLEVTDTEIVVNFEVAPPSGEANVKLYWYALRW
jgi:predicted ABC-class ATPase